MTVLPYELESPEYWAEVDYVLRWPLFYAPNTNTPREMVQVIDDHSDTCDRCSEC